MNPMMLSLLMSTSQPFLRGGPMSAELNVATAGFGEFAVGEVFSPPPLPSPGGCSATAAAIPFPHPAGHQSDSETTDCESDCGGGMASGPKKKKVYHVQNQDRLEKVSEFVEQLQSPPAVAAVARRVFIKRNRFHDLDSRHTHTPGSANKRIAAAEKAYELTDDDLFDDGSVVREKLSTFRKKRLAERTYEFKDEEDAENITPLPRLRQQRSFEDGGRETSATNSAPVPSTSKSPLRLTSECEVNILKPISSNSQNQGEVDADVSGLVVDTMPELLSPGGMVKKDHQQCCGCSPRPSSSATAVASSSSSQQQHQQQYQDSEVEAPQMAPRFHAKFTRRFIEMDDEIISVITDIEDEDHHNHAVMAATRYVINTQEVFDCTTSIRTYFDL